MPWETSQALTTPKRVAVNGAAETAVESRLTIRVDWNGNEFPKVGAFCNIWKTLFQTQIAGKKPHDHSLPLELLNASRNNRRKDSNPVHVDLPLIVTWHLSFPGGAIQRGRIFIIVLLAAARPAVETVGWNVCEDLSNVRYISMREKSSTYSTAYVTRSEIKMECDYLLFCYFKSVW